ncbi:MAG: TonB-dependent receptor plug domain-containing protein [Bacteroidota bacterium]
MKKILSPILFIILSISAFSQESKNTDISLMEQLNSADLDTIVKPHVIKVNTASRSLKTINELPVTSYVITQKEIQENNYRTLTDVLKNIPGVRISQPGDSRNGETFIINGLLGNLYTKILLNGIPITPSGAPGMPIAGQLPIRQALRIEFITNPSSALYGADAMGGVINIITEQNQKRATYGNAIFAIGDYGYNEINLMLGGRIGKDKNILKYNFIANHSDQSDLNTKSNYNNLYNINNYIHIDTAGLGNNSLFEGTATNPQLGNLPSQNLMYGIGIEYKSLKFSMFHLSREAHSAMGNLPYYTSYQLPDSYWGESINRYSLTYEIAANNFNSQTILSYLRYRINNGSNELVVNPIHGNETGLNFKYGASDDINFDQLFNYKVNKKSNIAFGANFIYSGNLPIYQSLNKPFDLGAYNSFSNHLNSNEFNYYILEEEQLNLMKNIFGNDYQDFSPFTFYQFGMFGQYDYSTEKLNLLLDLRFDRHSIYENSISPRASILYKITPKTSIKSTYTLAHKSPSSYFKYSNYAKPNLHTNYFPLPNSNMENERLQAIELGIKYSPSANNSFEILSNYYIRNNEIIFSFSNPDINESIVSRYGYYGYVNNKDNGSTNLSIQGIARLKNLIPSANFDLDASITYQNRTETTNPDILRYDSYRFQPSLLFRVAMKLKVYKNIKLITNIYGNNQYNNTYYEFFSEIFPEESISTILTDESNAAIWTDLSINYQSNSNFSFYTRIKNIFNSKFSGIQTADPLKGLYYTPQNGRMIEFGAKFKMF